MVHVTSGLPPFQPQTEESEMVDWESHNAFPKLMWSSSQLGHLQRKTLPWVSAVVTGV
jgi:hypothetical protein